MEYVHEQVPERRFKEVIIVSGKARLHKGKLPLCFEKFGAYEYRQMPDGMDFDYVIYFTDSSIDAYDYCIRERWGTRFTTDLHGLILRH